MVTTPRFLLARTDTAEYWAEARGTHVLVYQRPGSGAQTEALVLDVTLERLRSLVQWADKLHVCCFLSGPLADEVRQQAAHLALTTDAFVTTAVNAFLEAGKEAGHGHPH